MFGRGLRVLSRLLVLGALLAVAACVHDKALHDGAPVKAATPLPAGSVQCCTSLDRYPRWLVLGADRVAPVAGVLVAQVVWRHGNLRNDAARAAILARLQPLDLLVLSSKGRLSGHTIPGLFGHVAIYVGTERQLRQAGMWNDPRVRPFHDRIRAGNVIIEADYRGTHLSTAARGLDADRAVLIRPRLSGPARRRAALAMLFEHLGTPFDFNFKGEDPRRLYCSELANHVMPELHLPVRQFFDRSIIFPDEIVTQALTGKANYDLLFFMRSQSPKFEFATRKDLAADIGAAWADETIPTR